MEERTSEKSARINFRPLLFCALGLVFGISFSGKLLFGGLAPSDFLCLALFLGFALFPFGRRRTAAVLLAVFGFFGLGMFALFLDGYRFVSAAEAGEYLVEGVAEEVAVRPGYTVVMLSDLSLNGEEYGGKCRVLLDSKVRPADRISMRASVSPVGAEGFEDDLRGYFSQDVRYLASAEEYQITGRSANPFLRLNAALYDALHENMEPDEADLAYALLTGNARGMDEDVSDLVRKGGVAHIFAVSGLHIGILFGAAYFCFGFLKKYRALPALALAVCYCALCNFTVSSVRALVMCAALSGSRLLGKKNDFLDSLSLAAIVTLLFMPRQWYAAGMRLSYGACLGLALVSGPLSRLFAKRKVPRFLGGYLSSAVGVQIFTLPIALDSFGYVSALGFFWNFFLLPVMPFVFLGTLVCALAALAVPPAAPFFLMLPNGIFSVLLHLLSATDVSAALSGFSLGAGAGVFFVGCVALSGRVRLSAAAKGIGFAGLAALFAFAVLFENVVFVGCRVESYSYYGETAALIKTRTESVLVIDGDISVRRCEEFLNRTHGGTLSAVVVLCEDEVAGANTAAFLPAEEVRLCDECETGLHRELSFGREFSVGGLFFRYESRGKLLLFAEGCAVELDFEGEAALGADLFLGETRGRLNYFLRNGIIKAI